MVDSSSNDDTTENLLVIIQQLHTETLIDTEKRNQLKGNILLFADKCNEMRLCADMVFDDDAKLIGLHNRYRNEPAELKLHIAHYINNDNTFDAANI